MGLEPMALRLKVWCSTDWANRATHMHVLRESTAKFELKITVLSYCKVQDNFTLIPKRREKNKQKTNKQTNQTKGRKTTRSERNVSYGFLFRFGQNKTFSSPGMGLEPMTLRLKVWCSTDWANRAPRAWYSTSYVSDSILLVLKRGPLRRGGGTYVPSLNFKTLRFTHWGGSHVPVGILQ